MFTRITRDGIIMRIILYVDDALCTTNSKELWHERRSKIDAKFKMSEYGPLTNILGMNVIHDRINKTIRINQRLKIEALIERFGMQKERAMPLTPLAPGRTADRGALLGPILFGAHLGPFWALFYFVWGPFGALLGPFWAHLGPLAYFGLFWPILAYFGTLAANLSWLICQY